MQKANANLLVQQVNTFGPGFSLAFASTLASGWGMPSPDTFFLAARYSFSIEVWFFYIANFSTCLNSLQMVSFYDL